MTTAPEKIEWEYWETKPVTVQMKRFTGFGANGNGWALLRDLDDRGISADRDPDHPDRLRINTEEREESVARVGWWVVIGTRAEVYPIHPHVQLDKYRRPSS